MSWWKYVTDAAGTDAQVEIAKRVKVDQSTVSRWKVTDSGGKPENVRKVAEAYGRPVLEAFVAAGFLSPSEAKARVSAPPDLSLLTNDELLELVRARMREEGEGHGRPAANKPPATGPGQQPVLREVSEFEADVAAREDAPSKRSPRPKR